jgi:hypothetical protein
VRDFLQHAQGVGQHIAGALGAAGMGGSIQKNE